MTAQIQDSVVFRRKAFEVIGVEGEDPFDPRDLGIEPCMIHTACYAGFYCTFKISRRRLLLSELTVRDAKQRYPAINGVEPTVEEWIDPEGRSVPSEATYRGLSHPLDFTGRLRLARGFHDERYIHLGWQPADSYDQVIDASFEQGRLTTLHDRSAEIGFASVRRTELSFPIVDWIEERFSRRMDD